MSANAIETLRLLGDVHESHLRELADGLLAKARVGTGGDCILDCAGVTDFSGMALVQLAGLISSLHALGFGLVIANLPSRIRSTVVERVTDALAPPEYREPLVRLVRTAQSAAPRANESQPSCN